MIFYILLIAALAFVGYHIGMNIFAMVNPEGCARYTIKRLEKRIQTQQDILDRVGRSGNSQFRFASGVLLVGEFYIMYSIFILLMFVDAYMVF